MTKVALCEKLDYLIDQSARAMKANAVKLLNSGVIDLSEWADNFVLAKIMLCALLQEERFEYEPLDRNKAYLKLIDQLYKTL